MNLAGTFPTWMLQELKLFHRTYSQIDKNITFWCLYSQRHDDIQWNVRGSEIRRVNQIIAACEKLAIILRPGTQRLEIKHPHSKIPPIFGVSHPEGSLESLFGHRGSLKPDFWFPVMPFSPFRAAVRQCGSFCDGNMNAMDCILPNLSLYIFLEWWRWVGWKFDAELPDP